MRKNGARGWAAATGLGSLVLLLAACGGSSSSSAAGSAPSTSPASNGAGLATSSVSAAATATATATKSGGGSSPTASASHHSVAPQPSSGDQSIPAAGTTVMIVQHSAVGYVLAEANGQVVYSYARDRKGGLPTCTGTGAATWPPATGTPQAGPADHFPGTFGVIRGAGGVEQITYNGYPLYTLSGAKPLSVTGNGVGGVWHVIHLSASDISGG